MPEQHRDAFGRLAVDPDRLDRRARVDVLRQLAGGLQASTDRGQQWLGRGIGDWLSGSAPTLEHALAVRPAQGSRATPQRLVQADAQRQALQRVVAAAGSKALAARWLAGVEAAPGRAAGLVADALAVGCPQSRRQIQRRLSALKA